MDLRKGVWMVKSWGVKGNPRLFEQDWDKNRGGDECSRRGERDRERIVVLRSCEDELNG